MATKKSAKKKATAKKVANASTTRPETIQKHVGIMEKLVKRFKGKLPSFSWLNSNGFFRSYEVMRLNPDAFKHIIDVREFAR